MKPSTMPPPVFCGAGGATVTGALDSATVGVTGSGAAVSMVALAVGLTVLSPGYVSFPSRLRSVIYKSTFSGLIRQM